MLLASRLDKIDYLNNVNSNNKKIEPTFLSENIALSKENVLHSTSFKTILRLEQKDKSLIEIAKEKPKDHSIKQCHGAKIVIPKQIQKTLIEWYHNMLCHPDKTRTLGPN